MSIKCLRRHTYNPYVSCSPSKIPYVGFSPIRLQTGITPQPSSATAYFKCEVHIHYTYNDLYAAKALEFIPFSPYGRFSGFTAMTFPAQRPLALLWVMLSHWVFAYYGLIRDSRSSYCLIFFVQQVFALLPRMGWYRELPQFAQHIFSIVLYTVPRRSKRLLSAVASPFTLAFTLFG